jgi:hypothetical protein
VIAALIAALSSPPVPADALKSIGVRVHADRVDAEAAAEPPFAVYGTDADGPLKSANAGAMNSQTNANSANPARILEAARESKPRISSPPR